jgi:hypothetical protein
LSNLTATLGALTGLAALGSVYAFWRKRQTIPKLSSLFVKEHVETKVTSYYVRIEDINPKREGQVRWCAGSVTVNDNEYKTIWMFTNKRHHNFVKEAWLKLFDVDWKEETIGLFNTLEESNAKRSAASFDRLIGDNITIELEAARGRSPEPHNEKIEYLLK